MTLLQYTVPSTQGSFYLHTERIHRSLLRGKIKLLFAIINFQLFRFWYCGSMLPFVLHFVYLKQSLLLPEPVLSPLYPL